MTKKTDKPDPHEISDEYMTRERAAVYVKLSAKTLERLADLGDGPPFIRIGKRRVAYAKAGLDKWIATRTFRSRAHEMATAGG